MREHADQLKRGDKSSPLSPSSPIKFLPLAEIHPLSALVYQSMGFPGVPDLHTVGGAGHWESLKPLAGSNQQ